MKSGHALLLALLAVVLVILIFVCYKMHEREKFSEDVHTEYPGSKYNPYTVLQKKLGLIRGYRNDGYRQPPVYSSPEGLDRYHRSGAYLKPEQLAEAEREQWYSLLRDTHVGPYNTEVSSDAAEDAVRYHAPAPAMDHDAYVTDLVVDPRTKENHRKWVEEMKPWAGTATTVDTFDIEPYLPFQGLRRPQAVTQYNPLMLTEADTHDLAPNHKFNFRG